MAVAHPIVDAQLVDVDNQFGEQLAQARAERNISQAELARRINKKQPYIPRLEKGETAPTLPTLRDMAGALDADIVITKTGAVRFDLGKKGGK